MGRNPYQSNERVVFTKGIYNGRIGTLKIIGDEKHKEFQVVLPNGQTIPKVNKNAFKRAPMPPENSSSKEKNPDDSSEDEDEDEDEDKDIEVEYNDLEGREELPFEVPWKKVDDIPDNIEREPLPTHLPTFKVSHGSKPIDYFRMMFPMKSVQDWVRLTNRNIDKDPHRTGGHTDEEELLRLFGLRLQMIFLFFKHIHDFWALESPDGISPPTQFGRTRGMSLHRFETLERNLQFNTKEDYPDSKFWMVQSLVDDFNSNRTEVFSPGTHICADESVFLWTGTSNKSDPTSCPHKSHLPLKPVSDGILIKCCCCCETGIMLKMEIQEDAASMKKKKFQIRHSAEAADREYRMLEKKGDLHPYHVAIALRLTENYFGSRRVIYMDAHFASVANTLALRDHGLHSIGMVKGNTADYCMKEFKEFKESKTTAIGDSQFRITELELRSGGKSTFAAVATMREKRKVSTIISSVGNTQDVPVIPTRKRSIFVANDEGLLEQQPSNSDELYIPSMVSQYYKHAHSVDLHNQLRQGILNIERLWKTEKWRTRVFASILGVILVDAYHAFSYETKQYPGILDFAKKISLVLCPIITPDSEEPKQPINIVPVAITHHAPIELQKLSDYVGEEFLPKKEEKRKIDWRRYCTICGDRTYYFCKGCSNFNDKEKPIIVPMHGPESNIKCYTKHLNI